MLLLVSACSYDLGSLVQLVWSIVLQDRQLLFQAKDAALCYRIVCWKLLDQSPFDSIFLAFSLYSPDFFREFCILFVFFVVE